MKIISISAMAFLLPGIGFAQSPILASLEAQGIQVKILSKEQLSKIRGTARITDQPYPSVTQGIKIYNIRLKRFGNEHDYRSYYSVGSDWSPHGTYTHSESGIEYNIAGDRWLADKSDAPGGNWSASNAVEVDFHYQALSKNGTPLNFGWRETTWNRPISTFSW
ncbi:hypothetical protein HX881_20340 [Pseudomonas gingeri]|uniref:hypothetical protein n=1 Tax=Pseudomonas gingeri TaxID=117681 RepID=UPI0015A2248D|nr:hypothetical protein [Pseudomonas gingeri]NVZ27913.1 hypothetical protein [Pseudomonas gingeri]NVZ65329.1 hypothetical protein [Pseudomonas gingeri]NVZ74076.1 hypothetical protein [Pseudomonas gingeri]NWA05901.1 hypothetical protein [Pseudomonas gingeri]NWE69064.1 hypothetical protein [Pseudomonas gingeri]